MLVVLCCTMVCRAFVLSVTLYAVLCSVFVCSALFCCTVLYHATLCCAMTFSWCCFVSCCADLSSLYLTFPRRDISPSHCILLDLTSLHVQSFISLYFIWRDVVYCALLCCAVLCCAVLCCA